MIFLSERLHYAIIIYVPSKKTLKTFIMNTEAVGAQYWSTKKKQKKTKKKIIITITIIIIIKNK
jgi:hypothetical protein